MNALPAAPLCREEPLPPLGAPVAHDLSADLAPCKLCRRSPSAVGDPDGPALIQHFCKPRREFVSMTGPAWEIIAWWNRSNTP